jgi:hypothetical protein
VAYLFFRWGAAYFYHNVMDSLFQAFSVVFMSGGFEQPPGVDSERFFSDAYFIALTKSRFRAYFAFDACDNADNCAPSPTAEPWWAAVFGEPPAIVNAAAPGVDEPPECADIIYATSAGTSSNSLEFFAGSGQPPESAQLGFLFRAYRRHLFKRLAIPARRYRFNESIVSATTIQTSSGINGTHAVSAQELIAFAIEKYRPFFPAVFHAAAATARASQPPVVGAYTLIAGCPSPASYRQSFVHDAPGLSLALRVAKLVASLPLVVFMVRDARDISGRFVQNMYTGIEAFSALAKDAIFMPMASSRVPTCRLGHHTLFLRTPEGVPLRELAFVLSQASVLVSVEGAALANQIFLPLQSTLLALSVQRGKPTVSEFHGQAWHSSIAQYGRHRYVTYPLEGNEIDWEELIELIGTLAPGGT